MFEETKYETRLLLAGVISLVGLYLIWDLVFNGFSIFVLIGVAACFALAYFVTPRFKEDGDKHFLTDAFIFVSDIPFHAVSTLLRALGKLLKRGVDNVDL